MAAGHDGEDMDEAVSSDALLAAGRCGSNPGSYNRPCAIYGARHRSPNGPQLFGLQLYGGLWFEQLFT